jgi:hypothetical protein
MSWWAMAAPLIVALLVVLVPGIVTAQVFSVRGATAWGIAPALSMTIYTVLAVGFGILRIPWTAATVSVGVLVLVCVLILIVRVLLRRVMPLRVRPDRWSTQVAVAVGVLIAALIIGLRLGMGIIHPEDISQTFDNNFHLNGVRYVLSTGDPNPLTFSDLMHTYNGLGGFYPNLWHVVAALIAQISGSGIPITVNAFSIVVGGFIWTLGCVAVARQLFGPRPVALLITGLLSSCFAAFPILLVTWGVLYPNLLGVALIPAGLATLIAACGLATKAQVRGPATWILFAAILPGIALAHPNAFISLLGIGLPVLFVAAWRWIAAKRRAGAPRWQFTVGAVVAAAVLVAYAAIFIVVRPPAAAASWPPSSGGWSTIYRIVVTGQLGGVPEYAMSALALLGIIALIVQRRNRWLIASLALVEVLYFFVAYLPIGHWRLLLTGTWYSDMYRIIALLPIVMVPLAAAGAVWIGDLIAAGVARRSETRVRRAVGIGGGIAIGLTVVLGAVAQWGPSLASATSWAQGDYRLSRTSALVSSDEWKLIGQLHRFVPADALIAGDPWTGTSMAWALGDRRVLVPHIYGDRTAATNLILKSLRSASPGSAVCKAVEKEHVGYALDFGTNGVFGQTGQYPGVHHLARSRAMTLVDRVGTASLYRVTGCG